MLSAIIWFILCANLTVYITNYSYLRQGGYVFVVVCLSVCLSVSNFAQKNFPTDLHEIFREGWQRSNEQMIKFWWRSVSRDTDPDMDTDPYHDIGKTYFGAGMHCPSASSLYNYSLYRDDFLY